MRVRELQPKHPVESRSINVARFGVDEDSRLQRYDSANKQAVELHADGVWMAVAEFAMNHKQHSSHVGISVRIMVVYLRTTV
jgi:hypothetical protein